MTLSVVEWTVLLGAVGLAITIIGFFLKRTMNITDANDKNINNVMQTYATKDELKEVKADLHQDMRRLTDDVAKIKNNYLTKEDYYRKQAETDRKLEQIYGLLIEMNGGRDYGK